MLGGQPGVIRESAKVQQGFRQVSQGVSQGSHVRGQPGVIRESAGVTGGQPRVSQVSYGVSQGVSKGSPGSQQVLPGCSLVYFHTNI